MYTTILVPLDGSELAEKVLPHVVALAKPTGAEVSLLTVAQFTLGAVGAKIELIPQAAPEYQAALRAEAMLYLEKVQRDLKDQGVVAHCVVLEGDVAGEIIRHAEGKGVDVIAMATHGRSGITRFIMGSIAEKVLRGSLKPVLLIRALPVVPRQVDWPEGMPVTLP